MTEQWQVAHANWQRELSKLRAIGMHHIGEPHYEAQRERVAATYIAMRDAYLAMKAGK